MSSENENLSGIKSIHPFQKHLIEVETKKIREQSKQKVFYVIANYKDRKNEFDKFDLVDEAIFIQLSNNKYISWVWSDEGAEIGY